MYIVTEQGKKEPDITRIITHDDLEEKKIVITENVSIDIKFIIGVFISECMKCLNTTIYIISTSHSEF